MPPSRKPSHIQTALRRWYWLIALLLVGLVWAALALAMRPTRDADGSYSSRPFGLVTGLENGALDLLFQLRDARRADARARGMSEPITIVEVDEATIKASGVRLQKWPRGWYARLVDRASTGGASVIGLDILLGEEGGTSEDDRAQDLQLADSIAAAGNVVLAETTGDGGFEASAPLALFSDGAYNVGFVNLPLDGDNFVRSTQLARVLPRGETKLSFAACLAEGYLAAQMPQPETPDDAALHRGDADAPEAAPPPALEQRADGTVTLGARTLPMRPDQNLQLDFRARTPAFRRVSARDLLFDEDAQLPEDLFRDRIVIIGATNVDAPDQFPTPFYEPTAIARLFDRGLPNSPARTPGVEIHATSAATVLFGEYLTRPSYGRQALAVLVPVMLAGLAVFRLKALWSLLAVALVAAGALAAASWAFDTHALILPLASAWVGLGVLTPIGLGLRFAYERALRAESEAEREQVMSIFSRFVSEGVAARIWEQRGKGSLFGEARVVTVVFTDIRSFTTLSESVNSATVVEWLNEYFSRMNAIVESRGGHINKYIGDGLMIVFGAPLDRGAEGEARAAVECGLAMLAEVERINRDWQGTGRPEIKIGVGVHTGEATCGVIGAERRLEYTVIGDTVNLAARLESTTKEYGVSMLVSDSTAALLGDDFALRALGEVKVKGKTVGTPIYAVEAKGAERAQSALVADA